MARSTTYRFVIAVASALLAQGCAYQMQLMPRDSGTIYTGTAQSNGMGGGTLTVQLEGKTCSGSFAKAGSSDSFGFFQTYGRRGSSFGSMQSYGGHSSFKGLMSCTDGSGLRCDVEGGGTGAGICVDSNGRVFDMIYTMG